MGKILSLKYCTASGNDMMSALILVRFPDSVIAQLTSRENSVRPLCLYNPANTDIPSRPARLRFTLPCSMA